MLTKQSYLDKLKNLICESVYCNEYIYKTAVNNGIVDLHQYLLWVKEKIVYLVHAYYTRKMW